MKTVNGWFCSKCHWYHRNEPRDKKCVVCGETLIQAQIPESLVGIERRKPDVRST